jgi:hypothetical protein
MTKNDENIYRQASPAKMAKTSAATSAMAISESISRSAAARWRNGIEMAWMAKCQRRKYGVIGGVAKKSAALAAKTDLSAAISSEITLKAMAYRHGVGEKAWHGVIIVWR